nr:NPCBM/NEW2 domain-containing protein [Verrucomicrobiota bacterium]
LTKAVGSRLKLTELKPKVSKSGSGQVNIDKNAGGQPLRVGRDIAGGFGTHAPSVIAFDLPAGVIAFDATVGMDRAGIKTGQGATAVFQVFTEKPDDKLLVASPAKTAEEKPYGFEAAKASLEEMKVAEGLAVSLFAAEPMIQNPTNIDIDPRGRVWAVEAVNYRSSFKPWGKLREPGDRVVILEDTDGDGVADKEKTFWESKDLQAPLGICLLPRERGTQVIVSAAPNVWLLTDADGDDRAEQADLLFKIGGNWDHDHEVHAFVFGPDGKFYFNFGNEGRELKWPDGRIVTDLAGNEVKDGKAYRQGMVFRCDIAKGKASNVEVLGQNFRNNYELCVDSFGTMWQSDNDDDGNKGVRINYVMDYGNFGYTDEMTGAGWRTKRTNFEKEIPLQHWHQNDPGVVPNLLQTGGGSPTGILINEGTLLGKPFENQLIHADAGPRVVRAYPVEKDGAGYRATTIDILTTNDVWYRPSDVCIGPDGSLFISDWYDPGVGGHNMGDRDKDRIRGRIYRVAPKGHKPASAKVDVSTDAGAIAALQSPNNATRYLAWQKLHALESKAEPALLQLWKDASPRVRARALALLAQMPGSETKYLTAGLSDSDADLRCLAVRLTRMMNKSRAYDTAPLEENRALLGSLMQDPSPQVRREIALSLHGAKEIARLWATLALQYDGQDRWYLEALGIGSAGNEDECLAAWLEKAGDRWNTPAGRHIIWRLRAAGSAAYLARILTDKSTPEPELPRYLRAFDFLKPSPEKTRALVQLAGLGAQSNFIAVEALQRLKDVDLSSNPEVRQALDRTLAASRGTSRYVELVRDFKLKGHADGLLEFVVKDPASPEAVEATKALLESEPGAFTRALNGPDAGKVIEALGNTADQRAVALLRPLAIGTNAAPELRTLAVKALARSPAGAGALVKLAREGRLPEDLKLAAAMVLSTTQAPKLSEDIARLFPLPNAAGGKALPPIGELIKRSGDITRGKAVYEKTESACVTCHRVGNAGADFGPGLGDIGVKLGKQLMYESILAPNAGVSMGFETTQLALKSGDTAIGIVRSETEDEVVLAMPGGIQNRYKKTDIAGREKTPTSLMPPGLQQMMSTQDLVDLIEYLASLKAK